MKRKVLLIHNIMAPYRFPLFRALGAQPDIDLNVWFMSRSAANRRWRSIEYNPGFRYEVLPNIQLNYRSRDLFTYVLNYSFPFRYAASNFDVLISAGWLDFAAQTGFAVSKALRKKFILWSESTAFEPSWRRSLAQPLVKTMVRGSNALIGVGTRSVEYLRALGGARERIFTAYSTVDVDSFRRISQAARPQREALKASLSIRQPRVVLYCGQLIERKGLQDLLQAFVNLKQTHANVALVLVGYGPLRQTLLADAAERGMDSDVHVLEHVEVDEMPRLYSLADIFVLPSLEETWGLVVNEAMACGLPVVVTDRVGASVDLVRDGRNGFVVPAHDPVRLGQRLAALLEDDALRERLGQCSEALIANFTPERAAHAFAEAVRFACRSSGAN